MAQLSGQLVVWTAWASCPLHVGRSVNFPFMFVCVLVDCKSYSPCAYFGSTCIAVQLFNTPTHNPSRHLLLEGSRWVNVVESHLIAAPNLVLHYEVHDVVDCMREHFKLNVILFIARVIQYTFGMHIHAMFTR